MNAKSFLQEQEKALLTKSYQALARIFATDEGKQLLQTEDGKQYLQITTRDLPVIRGLLEIAPDDEPSAATDFHVTKQEDKFSVPLPIEDAPRLRTGDKSLPTVTSDEVSKRKSAEKVIEEILLDAPQHTMTVDQIVAASIERGFDLKKETLRFTLSAKDTFHPVEKGSGVWTLKAYAGKVAFKPKSQPRANVTATPMATDFQKFFQEGEFKRLTQTATIEAIWNRFKEVGKPDVFVDLQTAVWLCQWVGNPVGGEDVRNQRQNVSKLLRQNELFARNEEGHYGLRESLHAVSQPKSIFDFEGEESQELDTVPNQVIPLETVSS